MRLEERLRLLYEQFAGELQGFARRRVDATAAEDVVHDAYLRVATYPPRSELANPRAYLYRVTGNVASDYRLRSGRQLSWSDAEVDPQKLECPRADPERQAELRETLSRCLEALDELPPACRHVFLLHRVDGMTQREVATTLGIPLRTVERYIARALAQCLAKVQGSSEN